MAAKRVIFGSVNFKSFWTRICSVLLVLFLVLVPHRQDNLTSKSCRFSRANSCETSTFKSTDDALSFHVPSKHTRRRTFTVLKVPHNTGAISSFQLRLKSGDIHPNPGPAKRKTVKHPCGECLCNVRNNQDAILCGECQRWFHAKCINMGKATFKYYLENYSLPWTCLFCSLPKLNDSFFGQSSGDSDILRNYSQEAKLESDVIVVDHLAQTASKLASAPKDLRVVHLNIHSIRNKMEELRTLQHVCNFDIIGITETHLDKSVSDMKMFRQDREKCKGGGCVIYCRNYLNAIHRKDLCNKDLEAIWVQVKFPTANVLFSVMYRSELECPNFFEDAYVTLEKAWMKTDHIFLLGDFNCDLLNSFGNTGSDVRTKVRKLLHLFEQFDMQNVVEEPTRLTLETKTLIDLIVTTKPELINIKGVLPLGISDHNLIHATIKLRQKRPPPRIITIRNFKNFNIKEFHADLSRAPFYVANVFEDKDDVQWAWPWCSMKSATSMHLLKRLKSAVKATRGLQMK